MRAVAQPADLLGRGGVDPQDDVGLPRLVRASRPRRRPRRTPRRGSCWPARPRSRRPPRSRGATSLVTVAGVAATRVSRALVSRGTPIRNGALRSSPGRRRHASRWLSFAVHGDPGGIMPGNRLSGRLGSADVTGNTRISVGPGSRSSSARQRPGPAAAAVRARPRPRRLVLGELAGRRRGGRVPAYAVSLRGHGGSGRLRTARLRHYVDDVVAVASSLPRRPCWSATRWAAWSSSRRWPGTPPGRPSWSRRCPRIRRSLARGHRPASSAGRPADRRSAARCRCGRSTCSTSWTSRGAGACRPVRRRVGAWCSTSC